MEIIQQTQELSNEQEVHGESSAASSLDPKAVRRIARAIEYARGNNYAANSVYSLVAYEGLRLRVRLMDPPEDESEVSKLMDELRSFVQYSASYNLPIQVVETFLYSRGAQFELVGQEDGAGIDFSSLLNKQEGESNG